MSVIKKSSVFVVAFLALFAASARAQGIITVKVPFPFRIGHEAFPAGRYDIVPADFGSSVISIRGMDNRSAGFALTMAAGGRDPLGEQPALVFTKAENEYRLSEIWESNTEGRTLPHFASESKRASADTPHGQPADSTLVVSANWQ